MTVALVSACSDTTLEPEALGEHHQALNVCNETVPPERFVDGMPAYKQCDSTSGAIWSNNGVDTSATSQGADWVLTQHGGGTDLQVSRSRSLVDSFGRNSQQRMDAAGYPSQSWAEAFAFGGASPNDALSIMLAEADSCHGLMAGSNLDVGVAHIGDVDVLSLAGE